MNEKILESIKQLRSEENKKNFSQTFDLIVSLKEIDLKKPENKFTEEVALPHGKGEESNVVLFSDNIKEADCEIFTSSDLDRMSKNKREAKTLVKNTDFFLSEPKLMPAIGKVLGQFVGPRGKLPKLVAGDVKTMIKNYKKSVRVRVKEAPVIQCAVGKEKMKDDEIADNIEAVLKFLQTRLPKGKNNIGRVMLKLTMSKPVKLEV